jgi:cytochrome c55X
MHSPAIVALLLISKTCLAAEPVPERQMELTRLLYEDCGSCHGLSLKGGLGSPLVPEAMRPLSAEAIAATILDGRPGTPMPPWRGMLNEDDAAFLAQLLRGGAP